MRRHRQLSLAAHRALLIRVARHFKLLRKRHLLYIGGFILGHEVLVGCRVRTVEKGLAVDGTSLLELLLQLVGYHLLAETHLAQVDRAVKVLFASLLVIATPHLQIALVLDVSFETVLVLTLQGAPRWLGPTDQVLGSRLCHLHVSL